jgi:zinc D-Ala-D-Ala carboxypeptidase
MTQLTEHFTLEEFTVSETAARRNISNVPSPQSYEYKNLQRIAKVMEEVRILLNDKPIFITSGYRGPQVNAAVGGSKNSAHMSGLAVDFYCPDFGTPKQICKELEQHMKKLGIDQLIYEYGTWVHLGLSANVPRHMALTIDHRGTRNGFV